MNKLYALMLTLMVGLFFLIGGLISLKIKDKNKLNAFSVSLALIIMINLIVFDLTPEILELLEGYSLKEKIITSVLFILLGILVLKILDFFIPDHHHEHKENEKNKKEHVSHVKHIGILTISSLILHNLIEGFAIYGLALTDFKMGLFISLSVALHNIPLGTHIFSSIKPKENKIALVLLTLSSVFGGLIYLIIGSISDYVLAVIMLITLGMLIYIALFELLGEVWHNIYNKYSKYGLFVGLLIMIISYFM